GSPVSSPGRPGPRAAENATNASSPARSAPAGLSFSRGSVVVQVDQRDRDGARHDQERRNQQRDPQHDVLPGDVPNRLDRLLERTGLDERLAHPTSGSTAIAAKSNAR